MKELIVSKVFSHGIAIGPVFLVPEEYTTVSDAKAETEAKIESEIQRFETAAEKVAQDLSLLAQNNKIFAGHVSIIKDFTLHDAVKHKIREQHINAEQASEASIEELRCIFQSMDDPYMKERAADITDVGDQLLACLQNRCADKFAALKTPSVIIARNLVPSDTARLNQDLVLGFITEEGGVTSHVSIMAKSLNIPALVGATGILDLVKEDSHVVMDAGTGEIYVDPEPDFAKNFSAKKKKLEEENAAYLADAGLPTVTKDNRQLKVYANVGSLKDIEQAVSLRVDGVGLFRTEFLYMENSHFPTEEEQFEVYRKAVETLGHEIIIRTLDIGGDKELSYFQFKPEQNPFLGLRAIRFCLKNPDIFRTQIRAILRASHYGPLRIMLPMLISLEEAESALELIRQVKQELTREQIPFDDKIQVGMMMETPAAVFCADEFAQMMDFFSIGTNDLTQYTLAVDRGNQEIRDLYDPFYPAVIRAISHIIKAGHKAGIEVGMCGEFAGDRRSTKLLLGLGLDEFSMSASDTPRIKAALRSMNYNDEQKHAQEILQLRHAKEIKSALDN
ncbi:MAG: phosphoenolpyruvate--protein phosphotransferase [Oscillospiraceae bacterium]|nr:phosphoenolpyruvate--protein phosphotransferase [Oscillospiraceae bacterium]